jgi:hypothetical protein
MLNLVMTTILTQGGTLHEANIQIQAKVVVFDALRVAMRIALPASQKQQWQRISV